MPPYKQFPIGDAQKVAQMFTKSLAEIQGQWGALLGCKLTLSHGPVGKVTWQEAVSTLRMDVALAKMEAEGDVAGAMHVILDLRDAITVAAILTMLPKPQVQRKRQILGYDATVEDALGEACNVMRGAMNDVFHGLRQKAPRLKLLSVQALDPRDRKSMLEQSDGEYAIMRCTLGVDMYEPTAFYVLVSRAIVEYMLGIRWGA
ncbi:MAG: hypothetical protein EPO21_24675 [Chloroflexota bacterium]|nr:MAG: hypothetical protein EPO21_24675 [Chloroflexota bacterium]